MATETTVKTHKFKAEVSQVLSLVINSLYSNKDVFVREFVSNAADALDKLRFEAISRPKLLPKDYEPTIRLIPDAAARTLTVRDNFACLDTRTTRQSLAWSVAPVVSTPD